MKLDRIISIVMLLLGCETMSAPELSKIFTVSTRTIHRDLEVIRGAGIPLVSAPGVNGGLGIPEDFKSRRAVSSESDASDISEAILALLREYPGLVDDDSYIAAKYRNEMLDCEKSGQNSRTVVRVTLRFHESHRYDLENRYDLGIVSLGEDKYYKAYIYIDATEKEYDRLLLLGDKCECTDPRHVRGYIRGKIAAISGVYAIEENAKM